MKKLLIVLMVVAMASFLFVGCNGITPDIPVAVTGVTLDQETLALVAGGATGTLVETVEPADATDPRVIWASSDEAVATVDAGVVTPLTAGTADITVTTVDGGFTATCEVTVSAAPVAVTGVTLDQATLALTIGDAAVTLVATVAPADATDPSVTWASSDEAVAIVALGVVTPLNAGISAIMATTVDGGFVATCVVTVTAVEPDPNQAPVITSAAITSGKVGEEYIYNVVATDPDEDTLTYSLTEGPLGMAIVAATGVVSWDPTDAGVFPVGVKVSDPDGLFDVQDFNIAVAEADEPEPEPELVLVGIEVDPKTMDLIVGGSEEILSVTATYEVRGYEVEIDLEDCLFLTSDSEVATVDIISNEVEAIEEGTADIIVFYGGKTDTIAVTVIPVEVVRIVVDPNLIELHVTVTLDAITDLIDSAISTDEETIGLVVAHYNDGGWENVDLGDCDYLSYSEEIITVDEDGSVVVAEAFLLGIIDEEITSPVGTTITVKYEGKTDEVDVEVTVSI